MNIVKEIKQLDIAIAQKLYKDNGHDKHPTPQQMAIIEILIHNKDKTIYQNDLANELKVTKAAISSIIQSMEKKGFINKIPSSKDGRKNRIELTEETLNIYKDAKKNVDNLNKEIINNISEEELNIFLKVSNQIKNNIKKEGEENA